MLSFLVHLLQTGDVRMNLTETQKTINHNSNKMIKQYGKWKVVEGMKLHEYKNHVNFVQSDDSDELFVLKTPKPDGPYTRSFPDGTEERLMSNHNEEFRDEIRLAAMMDHPNVIKVVDYDAEAEKPWMVTEYCKGGTLEGADLDSWTFKEKWDCLYKISLGTQYIHSLGYTKFDGGLHNTFLKEDRKTPVIGDLERCRELTIESGASSMARMGEVFISLIEGKDFNYALLQERDLNKKIDQLTEQLEQVKQERAELLSP